MSTIAILLPSESPLLYKVENNQLISQHGTHNFSKIISIEETLTPEKVTSFTEVTLIVYTSKYTQLLNTGHNSLAASILEIQLKDAQLTPASLNVADVNWVSQLHLNDEFEYKLHDIGAKCTFEECIQKLNASMVSKIRVSHVNGTQRIVEVDLSDPESISHFNCLIRVVESVSQGDDYVPYRDNVLTKLMWSSLSGRSSAFNTIICMETDFKSTVIPSLSLANLLTRGEGNFSNDKYQSYTCLSTLNSRRDKDDLKHLKAELQQGFEVLNNIYTTEFNRIQAENQQKDREYASQVACAMHAIIRERKDTLSSLEREVQHLELLLSVEDHNQASRESLSRYVAPNETWLSEEIGRLQTELQESLDEKVELLKALEEANKYEVDDAFRDIIAQAEFNLKSMKSQLGQ